MDPRASTTPLGRAAPIASGPRQSLGQLGGGPVAENQHELRGRLLLALHRIGERGMDHAFGFGRRGDPLGGGRLHGNGLARRGEPSAEQIERRGRTGTGDHGRRTQILRRRARGQAREREAEHRNGQKGKGEGEDQADRAGPRAPFGRKGCKRADPPRPCGQAGAEHKRKVRLQAYHVSALAQEGGCFKTAIPGAGARTARIRPVAIKRPPREAAVSDAKRFRAM
ncbi:MAG: hypothetical protein B7Y95_16355 [Rhizobiales bacterium 32-66-11]|nr:MAG: hypothetical protein B7Y95_16355 [Rhizobiales bacterium 32-66-11]